MDVKKLIIKWHVSMQVINRILVWEQVWCCSLLHLKQSMSNVMPASYEIEELA